MITLDLSESYCYDMLAILAVKLNQTLDDKTRVEYIRMSDRIAAQVPNHQEVVRSPEYNRLYEVNREMFVRIDELKQRKPTGEDAQYIDDRVYARFKAKQALQARWFPDQPLTEIKYGYTGQEDKRV